MRACANAAPTFIVSLPETGHPEGASYTVCLAMRRITALALTMIFSWMLIAPLFSPDADANLPPCCRRNGKHHCMMRAMEQLSGKRKGFSSVTEKCPCLPASTCAVYSPIYDPQAAQQFYAEVVHHPVCTAQTQLCYRHIFLCSHQKRAPPSPLA